MNITVNRARIGGLVAVVVAAASIGMALVAHKGLPFRSYNYVEAAFDDVSSVRSGDDVRVAGVRIGQVHDVDYVDGEAVVEMQIPGDYPIHADATSAIGARNALGQRFVHLDPGTSGSGPLDAMIPRDRTESAVELDRVLDELDAPTREALQGSVTELGSGSLGRGADLNAALAAAPDLLDDLGLVASELTEEDAELIGLLSAADRLASRFQGRTDELAALLPDAATTMGALATNDGTAVGDALAAAPDTLARVEPALRALGAVLDDTGTAFDDLGPGLESLGRATPDLRGLLIEATDPLADVPGVAGKAVPALTALESLTTELRPLAPQLGDAARLSRSPLATIAPYSPDVANWFIRASDAIDEGDTQGNWLRFIAIPGPGTTSLLSDCRNPYPAPGEAETDRSTLGGC